MAEQCVPMEKRITITLLSKTGHGKSSLANALLRTDVFKIGRGMNSATTDCQYETGKAAGRDVAVVDTPGTMDTDNPNRALKEICNAITLCPIGIDVFLCVLRCDVRFTAEEQMVFTLLEKVFGEKIYNHCIVVFSHGDEYDNDEEEFRRCNLEDRSQIPFLSQLMDKCGNRFLLMDNGRNCNKVLQQQQVEQLMDMVEELRSRNQECRYTNEYFQLAQKRMKEGEERIKWEHGADIERLRKQQREIVEEEFKDQRKRLEEEIREKVIQELKQEINKDGKFCFPADATVQTPQGPVRMNQLSLGQKVLCIQNNKLTYSPVYMWGHRDEASCSDSYVTLRTESAELILSSDHLLFITDEMGNEVSVAAADVCAGQIVQVLDSSNTGGLSSEQVLTVQRRVTRRGLFAPFTLSGNIIVDGVLASCYVRLLPPALSHALLWPVRLAWQLKPSAVNACNQLGEDGMPGWVSLVAKQLLPKFSWLAVGGRKSVCY